MNTSQRNFLHRLVFLHQEAVDSEADSVKLRAVLGQHRGNFLATHPSPRKWIDSCLDSYKKKNPTDTWGLRALKEFLINLGHRNSLIESGQGFYEWIGSWSETANALRPKDGVNARVIDRAPGQRGFPTLKEIDIEDLEVTSTVDFPRASVRNNMVSELAAISAPFVRQSPQVAIVSRHNSLTAVREQTSRTINFLTEILKFSKGGILEELILFTRDTHFLNDITYKNHDELFTKTVAALSSTFSKKESVNLRQSLPPGGIVYVIGDDERTTRTNLHTRLIVTHHVVLQTGDDISVSDTSPQRITRNFYTKKNNTEFEEEKKRWFGSEHGFDELVRIRIRNDPARASVTLNREPARQGQATSQ